MSTASKTWFYVAAGFFFGVGLLMAITISPLAAFSPLGFGLILAAVAAAK